MVLKESDVEELERGDSAPDFELKGTDGETYSLEDFKDKEALLIVFTCNHCPYAQAKIPVLNELAHDYDNVAVIGINPNDEEQYPEDSFERMKELVQDGTVQYDAYLRDETQEVAKAYGAVCTPDPYLFRNTYDTFRLAYHGRLDDVMDPESDREPQQEDMREAIEAVLNRNKVEKEFIPSRGCSIKWLE